MSQEKAKKHEDNVQQSAQSESKMYEGQSAKPNSCSSCKIALPLISCWDNLPSVILLELFSYLSRTDRINASQVCKNWRMTLYHPSFWKQIVFDFKDKSRISWYRSLGSCFALSVQDVTIRWNDHTFKDVLSLLTKLSYSRQLHKLVLEPNISTLQSYINKHDEKLIESILRIMENANSLQHLNLGCIEDIAPNVHLILESLKFHQSKHLTHLCLASVKDDPNKYEFTEVDSSSFCSFPYLTTLSIDYEFVNDALLKALDNGLMEKIVIHVHGWEETYAGTSNQGWEIFCLKNPRCQLRLSLIHAYDAVQELHEILQPAMPLTHLKVLFCEYINYRALNLITHWYTNTLQSFIWIDSSSQPVIWNHSPQEPDPILIIAWKCHRLIELVFMGYEYYLENLVGILRLRADTLKRLEFRKRDLKSLNKKFLQEIKRALGEEWGPLSDDELPKVMKDSYNGDSREMIMPLVLADQC